MVNVSRIKMTQYSHWAALLFTCFLPSIAFAYSVTLSVDVNVSRVHERNDSVLVSCSMSHTENSAMEKQFTQLSNGAFSGAIEISLDSIHPLFEYELLVCDIRLCGELGYEETCDLHVAVAFR